MADTTSPEDQNNEAREEFPQKLRVHALARLLGLTSKEVLAHLGELGFVARSAHSSIDRSAAERVRDRVAGVDASGADPEPTNAEASEPAAAEAPTPTAADATPSLFSAAAVAEPVVVEQASPAFDANAPLFLQPEQVEQPARLCAGMLDSFDTPDVDGVVDLPDGIRRLAEVAWSVP